MSKRKFESLAAGEGGGAGTSAGDEGGGASGTPQHRPMLKSKVNYLAFLCEQNLGACGTAPGLILGGTVSVWFLQRLPSAGGNHCVTAPEQILDAGWVDHSKIRWASIPCGFLVA